MSEHGELILGIETSCDDTSLALVDEKGRVFAEKTINQFEIHAGYGGVFPELASRAHVHALMPAIDDVLKQVQLHDAKEYAVARRQGGMAEEVAHEVAGERWQARLADIGIVDLYSCFPAAVQLGAQSLGLDINAQLTRTGGLPFAGGPWNNYVMHAIATVANELRSGVGSIGYRSVSHATSNHTEWVAIDLEKEVAHG